jgi:hypothetical protein
MTGSIGHSGLGFLGSYVGHVPLTLGAPNCIGFERTGFALHIKLVADGDRCTGQQSFADTDSRHRAAVDIAEKVEIGRASCRERV